MGKIGVIQEQGDYGLGFDVLNDKEQKHVQESYYANKNKAADEYAKQKRVTHIGNIFTQVKSK